MRIAVVGGGLSGASAVKSLVSHANFEMGDQIDVFEPRKTLGVGLPYDADDESVMLNVGPDLLSVDGANPLDFTEWLDEQYEEPTNFEKLVSRPRYGKYLAERFAAYFNHEQVIHVQTKVVDVEVLNAKTGEKLVESKVDSFSYRLETVDGWHDEIYDAVFLAVGHPPYADYYDLEGEPNYIHNPYPMKLQISDLTGEERVGIIGSGATGVDLMRFFHLNYELKQPLTYYVQDEVFNFVNIPYEKETFQFTFSKDWIAQEKENHNGLIPFDLILSTFMEDIKAGGVDVHEVYERYTKNDLNSIRAAIESNDQELALIHVYHSKLVGLLPYLFNTLSGEDKEFYLANYHRKMLFFKSRVPHETFKWLLELMDAGKLRIVKGLTEIQPQADGSFAVHANEKEEVDILVNATGFDTRLSKAAKNSALIRNLFHHNIIMPQSNGRFVLVDWPQAQILNQRFGLMDNLFFFGLLIGGTQHENNDAQLTIQQASSSAKWFMDQRVK